MTEVVKRLLIANPDPHNFNNLCRLCGRYNWNMTNIFDITNRYDYGKVINLHFHDFHITENDDLPLKLCIQCVATLTGWHEFYNSCIDVNRRLKLMKLQSTAPVTIEVDIADDSDDEVSLLPDHQYTPNDNNANTLEVKNLNDKHGEGDGSAGDSMLSIARGNSRLPLEVDLSIDEENDEEFKNFDDGFNDSTEIKHTEGEAYERRDGSFTDDIEVIEIKMSDEDSELKTEVDSFDDDSCLEDEFDDIENVHIQEEAPSPIPSESIPTSSTKDKLDSEEMAILHHDLNTVVNETTEDNEGRKTVVQPSSQMNDKFSKLKRSTVCRICGKLYVTRTSYLRHLIKQHSNHSSAKLSRTTPVKSGAAVGKNISASGEEKRTRGSLSVSTKEEPSRTMCDVCGKTFRFASSYRKHFRDFHSDGPPKPKPIRSRRMCDLCGKLCSGGSFKGHMKKHTNPESVTCPHCGQLFSFESVLKSHIKVRHSNERPFQCELCESNFKRADYLRSHMRYKHEPKLLRGEAKSSKWTSPFTFRCGECDASFKNQEALDKHLNMRVPAVDNGGTETVAPKCPSVFRCEECDLTFKKRNYLMLHKRYIHDKHQPFRISATSVGPYKCDRCERRFASVCGRNYHCKSVHGSIFDTKFSEICDHCGLTFKNRVFYAKHCAKLRDKPTCYLCWSAFDEEAALKQHMHDVHVDDLPFLCELCNRRFVTLRQLHDHIKSRHAKIRPFKCSYCSHTAVRKDSLEVHIRGCHLGQKPFKCDLCEKAFSQSSDLRKHRVTHTRNRLTQVRKKKILIEEPELVKLVEGPELVKLVEGPEFAKPDN